MLSVNVPIGLAAAVLAPMLVAESRSDAAHRHFDVAGAVTVTAGLSILVYALVDADDAGWGSAQTIGLLALAVALLGAFVAIERAPRPAACRSRHLPAADADRRQRASGC